MSHLCVELEYVDTLIQDHYPTQDIIFASNDHHLITRPHLYYETSTKGFGNLCLRLLTTTH